MDPVGVTSKRTCRVDGCEKKILAQGLCSAHYTRLWRSGELSLLQPERGPRIDQPIVETTSEQRAYFAGYFDGEGCVRLTRSPHAKNPTRGYFILTIEFSQTRPDVVVEMYRHYGGKLRIKIHRNERWRPAVKWVIARRLSTIRFLEDLRPYVREKRDQVEMVLASYHPRMSDEEGEALQQKLSQLKAQSFSIDEFMTEHPTTIIVDSRTGKKKGTQ